MLARTNIYRFGFTSGIVISVAVGSEGGGTHFFDRSVNPISTRGADYANHITIWPPRFSDLLTVLAWYYAKMGL